MTLLFPEYAPPQQAAISAPRSSVHTLEISTPNSVTRGRPRVKITLPSRRPGPREQKTGEDTAFLLRQRAHAEDRRAAVDVIGAALTAARNGELGMFLPRDDEAFLERERNDLISCEDVLAFRHLDPKCNRQLVRPKSCHSRVCPSCESQRANKLAHRIEAFLEQGVPQQHRRKYLVLTTRNTFDLATGYSANAKAFSRLRSRPLWKGGKCRQRRRDGRPFHPCVHPAHPHCRDLTGARNCPAFRHKPVEGGIVIDEVTTHECNIRVFNKRTKKWYDRTCDDPCPWVGSFHPHLNVIADAPWLIQAELADAWREVTCPEHRGPRRCPEDCRQGSDYVWIEEVDPNTVREAAKYVTKPAALVAGDDPLPLIKFLLATRGRRLVRGFGSFFNVEFDREEAEETVTKWGGEIAHDRNGIPIYEKFTLPRYCPFCGGDTRLGGDAVAWDLPDRVRRELLVLVNGMVTVGTGPPTAESG